MSPTGASGTKEDNSHDHSAEGREIVHEHEHGLEQIPSLNRNMVICVDDSVYSQHAYEWMLENVARKETDLLIFLNCRQMSSIPVTTGIGDMTAYLGEIELENRRKAHELLLSYARDAKERGFHVRALALRSGSIKEELVREIKKLNANLVAIGSRGMGIVKRTFLGSISDYMAHHVHAPVIIVRMTDEEEQSYKLEKKFGKPNLAN